MKKRENVRILIVEDDPGQVELALLSIKRANESGIGKTLLAEVARDGQEAVDLLAVRNFDLILLDLKLPRMNGLEVLNHIKSDKRLRVIPVYMLTTSDLDEDISRAYNDYVSGYIVKPPTQSRLNEIMANLQLFLTMDEMRLAT